MAYGCRILCDSLNVATKDRLTTFELCYPRMVHAELMTHRLFSRNSASSRAIPVEKMLKRIQEDPVIPVHWGRNQKGMQAHEELSPEEQVVALRVWLEGRDNAVATAKKLLDLGVHKQIANRVTEPWMWITVLVTATEFENWFALRLDPDAQPEIQKLAQLMMELYEESTQTPLQPGEWHLPLIYPEDEMLLTEEAKKGGFTLESSFHALKDEFLPRISAGRCARVSYLTHDGKRDLKADIDLCKRLSSNGHWSPFEHPSIALEQPERWGNFVGWKQLRKFFHNEHRGRKLPEGQLNK